MMTFLRSPVRLTYNYSAHYEQTYICTYGHANKVGNASTTFKTKNITTKFA